MPLGTVHIEGIFDDRWKIKSGEIEFIFDQTMLKRNGWGSLSKDDIKDKLDVEFDLSSSRQLSNVRLYSVVPSSVRSLVNKNGCVHPGLILDKFAYHASEQAFSKMTLSEVIKMRPSIDTFNYALQRRKLEIASSLVWSCRTRSYITLHLSRASALENAGICLHPLYGFGYLPGSGLKGMARAYAETIWLSDDKQSDKRRAWMQIEEVFGWAPGSDVIEKGQEKPWKPRGIPKHEEGNAASAGTVVFHDAWPEEYPKLLVDITNNHHSKYYKGKDNQDPPGDWEDPIPVYFLAIGPGNIFNFAISKRRDDVKGDMVNLAKEWLTGALCYMGTGAKTNAGYGYFEPTEDTKPSLPKTEKQAKIEYELEFVTPAFLAGAYQKAEDCELRPATLRGQLRWWWRTMHAGWMDTAMLRELEGTIWGDTRRGGAVRITVESVGERPRAIIYDKKSKAEMTSKERATALGRLVKKPDKVTQGLWYHSYGMDDSGKRRYYIEAGNKYKICITIKTTEIAKEDTKITISMMDMLEQVKSALWLLSRFGGVGAKSRKGFGCFRELNELNMDITQCKNIALVFRKRYKLATNKETVSYVATLENIQLIETQTKWKTNDIWFALDQIGFAAQAFAKKLAHNRRKMGLGLPRRIGPPPTGRFKAVYGEKRHASPVHYHIDTDQQGTLNISVAMFPVSGLDGFKNNKMLLQELCDFLQENLKGRASCQPKGNNSRTYRVDLSGLPDVGDVVDAEIVPDPKGKGRPWARMKESPLLSGNFINPDDFPQNMEEGQDVSLKVNMISVDGKSIRFEWPVDK